MHDNRERTAQVKARGGRQIHGTVDAIQITGREHDSAKDLRSQIHKASAVLGFLRDTVW